MSNSPLITCTALSPNYTKGRAGKTIDTITLHVYVGQIDLKKAKSAFMNKSRQASSNYIITKDGEIVLKVDEANRSWCSGGAGKKGKYYKALGTTLNETGSTNDYHAVTVEIASDSFSPYKITDKALNAAIKLCADIAKRNNLGQLIFKNDPKLIGYPNKQNMTMHKWFDVNQRGFLRACPGAYLQSKLKYICQEANKINSGITPAPSNEYIYNGVNYVYVFNPEYYRQHQPDVANDSYFGQNNDTLFEHFCKCGMKEGRQADENFNVQIYKANYPDLQAAFGNDLPKYYGHYCTYGYFEGRNAKTPLNQTVQTPSETVVETPKRTFNNGDVIKLKKGATYYNGKKIPLWVIKSKLYCRGTNKNGIIFSTKKTGAITGTVKPEMIIWHPHLHILPYLLIQVGYFFIAYWQNVYCVYNVYYVLKWKEVIMGERLNLKLPTELKEYLKTVSWENKTSVTQYLIELIEKDRKEKNENSKKNR